MEKTKEGFTLLELLVVVLIIGILAAIALPQYQMAVGKAKFSTLKNLTKSLQQAAQRYYLAHNKYPKAMVGLDINLSINEENLVGARLEIKVDDIECTIWTGTTDYIACQREIFGHYTHYYLKRETGTPLFCIVSGSPNPKGMASRLCAKETNRSIKSTCNTTCEYSY